MRALLLVLFLLAPSLAGCGAPYEPGDFTDRGRIDEPRLRALGCVDVRVQPRGEGAMSPSYLALDVELGNRCLQPVEVDLGRVAIEADFGEGGALLETFDPRGEIVPAVLDGRSFAREAIAFRTGRVRGFPTRLCVHVSEIVSDERAAPVCFLRDGASMRVEVM